MPDLLDHLRVSAGLLAARARQVTVNPERIPSYTDRLPLGSVAQTADPETELVDAPREALIAFWITLDAINFGSGWFPTLRKRDGRSGYFTVAAGVRDRFAQAGPWSAQELASMTAGQIAGVLGQDPGHELMALFAHSLRDLGRRLLDEHSGSFGALVDSTNGSAVALVEHLSGWECFRDVSHYDGLELPFLKRAQITAADLHRAGLASARDSERLTMFADNLVPHVLRVDGVLTFDSVLVARIERGELIEHGSPEEVEIRACAVHAVELMAAARPGATAAGLDQALWLRGQQPRYKAVPRHRCRCTAY